LYVNFAVLNEIPGKFITLKATLSYGAKIFSIFLRTANLFVIGRPV